jgi:hypothetical protein
VTRKMYDAAVPGNIPASAPMIAVYFNGAWPATPAELADRFDPRKTVTVWIDVIGDAPLHAQVLDVERMDAPAARAPGWIKERAAAVHTSLPTVYCNRSTLPSVTAVCRNAGLAAGKHYQLWISCLDGQEAADRAQLASVAGVVAAQYQGGPTAPYDISDVYDDRWHPLA